MIYLDGDNSLESASIEDFHEMGEGLYQQWLGDYQIDQRISIIVQYDDRFRKQQGRYEIQKIRNLDHTTSVLVGEIEGTDNEVDMGDAQSLKEFIQFCKEEYPSKNYALFLWNHGGGVRDINSSESTRAICWDSSTEEGTPLYIGEISDVLGEDDSVDFLAMDACLMGMNEIAYQFRPRSGAFGAQTIAFSPATEPGDGYEYDALISSIDDITNLTSRSLAQLVVDTYREHYGSQLGETQTAVDLTLIDEVKEAQDALAALLIDKKVDIEDFVRGDADSGAIALHYFDNNSYEWSNYANFDLYDVTSRIKERNYSAQINSACDTLLVAIDNAVIDSYYGGSTSATFEEGKHGLGFFFPDGDGSYGGGTYWQSQYFYTPLDNGDFIDWAEANLISWDGYGALESCSADNDTIVESWFELLQYWYNPTRDEELHPGPMW